MNQVPIPFPLIPLIVTDRKLLFLHFMTSKCNKSFPRPLSLDEGNSYLAVDGSAQLSSTNFPVVSIDGDDKRLRCFSMNYKILTRGTLLIHVDGYGNHISNLNISLSNLGHIFSDDLALLSKL